MVRGRACLRQRASASGPDRYGDFHRSARLCRGRPEVLALAHDAADGAGGLFQAGWHGELRRQAAAAAGVRSAAAGSHGDDLGLPCGVARGWRCRMEGRRGARIRLVSRRQRSVVCRWSTWRREAAAMGCIPTAPTRTGAANPSCPICSASRRFVSLLVISGDRAKLAPLRALRA